MVDVRFFVGGEIDLEDVGYVGKVYVLSNYICCVENSGFCKVEFVCNFCVFWLVDMWVKYWDWGDIRKGGEDEFVEIGEGSGGGEDDSFEGRVVFGGSNDFYFIVYSVNYGCCGEREGWGSDEDLRDLFVCVDFVFRDGGNEFVVRCKNDVGDFLDMRWDGSGKEYVLVIVLFFVRKIGNDFF